MNNNILDDEFLKNEEIDFAQITFSGKLAGKAWKLEQAVEKIRYTRNMLFFLGGTTILSAIFVSLGQMVSFDAILQFVAGFFLLGCAFMVKRYPIVSISIPFGIYLFFQLLVIVFDASSLYRGLAWRIAIISLLSIGLYNAFLARDIKAELIEAAKRIKKMEAEQE